MSFPHWLRLILFAVLALSAGCSQLINHDPVFVGFEGSETDCAAENPDTALCVTVRGEIIGTRAGVGICHIRSKSAGEDAPPLLISDVIEIIPGTIAEWSAELPPSVKETGWFPVCFPVAEG